jgi:hypothetical protein
MKYAKLHPVKFGGAWGILGGVCVLTTTLLAMTNFFQSYTSLAIAWIEAIYGGFGYSVSILGAILGGVYGFIDIFVAGYIFAIIYNKL